MFGPNFENGEREAMLQEWSPTQGGDRILVYGSTPSTSQWELSPNEATIESTRTVSVMVASWNKDEYIAWSVAL